MNETVGSALAAFRAANRLDQDEHRAACWIVKAGPVSLPFPNFAWRRRAIGAHDVHHLMTGYPCTVPGELQIAAWELGAGRYPHWGATLFCMPLAVIGLFWSPRRIWTAYRRGRSQRTLYHPAMLDQLFDIPLTEAQRFVDRR